MPARPVRVGRSATGLGLFAAKAIARNTVIVAYRGKRIPTAQAHERERRYGAKYMFELNCKWSIDGSPRWNSAVTPITAAGRMRSRWRAKAGWRWWRCAR